MEPAQRLRKRPLAAHSSESSLFLHDITAFDSAFGFLRLPCAFSGQQQQQQQHVVSSAVQNAAVAGVLEAGVLENAEL